VQRYEALDGIRGIAAFLVAFVWHYPAKLDNKPFELFFGWFYNHGWIMVDLFFVLSGFIFYMKYLKAVADRQISFHNFAVLRFSRLYPLHWLTFALAALLLLYENNYNYFLQFPNVQNDLFTFTLNIFYVQNGWLTTKFSFGGAAWSTSIEIMMYLLFFVIARYFGNSKRLLYVIAVLFLIAFIIYLPKLDMPILNTQVVRGIIGFFGGCLTAYIYIYIYIYHKTKRNIILAIAVILAVLLILYPNIYGYPHVAIWSPLYICVLFPSILLITLMVGIIGRVLSIKPFLYLGTLSYTIYLLSGIIVLLVKTFDDYFGLNIDYSTYTFFISNIVITIFISHFVYRFYEKPMQDKIRHWLIHKKQI
jgi:peptidoglycan/LPS O-acetylase OafA/YrhL